jgi:Tfp pilus assembly protein FimT
LAGTPSDGVSAVELAMVLFVLSIITIIVVPVAGDLLSRLASRGAVEQVASVLKTVRQYAVGASASYDVVVTASTMQVVCFASCPPNPPGDASPQAVLHNATLSAGACTLPCTIRFDRLGALATAAGVEVSRSGVPQQSVCASTTGRVYAKAPGSACP